MGVLQYDTITNAENNIKIHVILLHLSNLL